MAEQSKQSQDSQIYVILTALAFVIALFLGAGGYMDWAILMMLAALVLKPR